ATTEGLVPGFLACRVVALAVRHPLERQTFEERVDVLVVLTLAVCGEPARQEQLIDPVLDVVLDAVLDERTVDVDAVHARLTAPFAHPAAREIDQDAYVTELKEHRAADTGACERRDVEQRLEPPAERRDDVVLTPGPRCLLGRDALLPVVAILHEVRALVA